MTETIKKIQLELGVVVDGIIGKNTLKAIGNKIGATVTTYNKQTVKNIQKKLGVTSDGIIGKNTLSAIIKALNINEDSKEYSAISSLTQKYIDKPIVYSDVDYKAHPVKQSILRKNGSIFGKAGNESVLVNVPVPANYPLKYDGKPVKTIRIHKLAADRLEAALKDIINHYGEDIEKVAPGACVYDGSYYFRNTRNSSSTSVHSWGLALDFDAANNALKTKSPNARLSQEIYKPFWDILEHHGFLSLGRRQDSDWMHLQMTLWG